MGLTNNFLTLNNDILYQLYEESVLENHHFHVAMTILQVHKIKQNKKNHFNASFRTAIYFEQ